MRDSPAPVGAQHTPGLYSGRYFGSSDEAARQFQYEAQRRAANAREVRRFGELRCSHMQREAADLYAAARAAIAGAGGVA